MTDLKPCPCCGGAAEKNYTSDIEQVLCTNCGLQTEWMLEGKAIEAWNRRPTTTVRIEKMKNNWGSFYIQHCVFCDNIMVEGNENFCPNCGKETIR